MNSQASLLPPVEVDPGIVHRVETIRLRKFQRKFVSRAFSDDVRTAVLSLPRGNGKSTLSGHILARCMTPGDELNQPGAEYLLLAASVAQARHVFRALRAELQGPSYRWQDSSMTLGVTHKATGTRVKVLSSNGKTAMGMVGNPIAVCDEPGSWETNAGGLMWAALRTAQGKPQSALKIIMIGTVAPAMSGWWPDLVAGGSNPATGLYVQALQGDLKRWDEPDELMRCNPLMRRFPQSRSVLLSELDEAKTDTGLKAQFLSYRLNIPSADESDVVLTLPDWQTVVARDIPPRSGRPVVGVDMGQSRSWCSAVAIWESGRAEALAVSPGVPSIPKQESRDKVPAGEYQALVDAGTLSVADGLQVPTAGHLVSRIFDTWGAPAVIVSDRFRAKEFADEVRGRCRIDSRVSRYSECAADIRMLRRLAKDGIAGTALAVSDESQGIIAHSLGRAVVKSDDSGNTRIVKQSKHQTARDDIAAALVLAAGHAGRSIERRAGRRRSKLRYAVAG